MPHENSLIQSLFGDIDTIVKLLGIETFSEEDQLKVVDRFAEILFKRILLHIPKDAIGEVQKALESDPETFLRTIESVIPDIESTFKKEIQNTLADFGIEE